MKHPQLPLHQLGNSNSLPVIRRYSKIPKYRNYLNSGNNKLRLLHSFKMQRTQPKTIQSEQVLLMHNRCSSK